jgi:CRISPR-associated protein Cmr3
MKTFFLCITPHDPIIARDGRPFGVGQGIRMKSLDWPYPSVLAGSLRTMLGKINGGNFDEETVKDLKALKISGPLPLIKGRIHFPAPKDILVNDEQGERQCYAIRPMEIRAKEGCDLPESVLPSMLPESVHEDFKPAKVPAFWSVNMITKWLINPKGNFFDAPPEPDKVRDGDGFFNLPHRDQRIHIWIDSNRGASKEKMLFESVGLDLSIKDQKYGIQLAARVESKKEIEDLSARVKPFHTLGGERRLAHWEVENAQRGWNCPNEIEKALAGKKRIRMILASPAIFSDGWKPGWLNDWPEGEVPDYWPNNLRLKLISACIDRWKPVSGWSLECLKNGPKPGPKPIRRLVPAGSVYFFEVLSGNAEHMVKNLWLRSVCDEDQDRRDGFGLAVWGLWDYADCEEC